MENLFSFSQSGVIPYRFNGGIIEILLITSLSKKKWIIPKGFVEFTLSAFESAVKEAYEEAGIVSEGEGEGEGIELGIYQVRKGAALLEIKVFGLEVKNLVDDFPEAGLRKRKWFAFDDALGVIDNPLIAKMIYLLKEKLV